MEKNMNIYHLKMKAAEKSVFEAKKIEIKNSLLKIYAFLCKKCRFYK